MLSSERLNYRPSGSRSSSRLGSRRLLPALGATDPLEEQQVGVDLLLDVMNIQGPKLVALTAAVLGALSPQAGPARASIFTSKANSMTNAAVQAMIETGIVPSAEALPSVAPLVREHMRAALPALTPELLWALLRCMSHFPSWKPDASGRVDNPPTLEGTTDGGLSFTQEQLHALRHVMFAHLPVWVGLDAVLEQRSALLAKPLPAPSDGPPCAIVTVGPVGSGKSWVLHGSDSPLDGLIASQLGGAFPAPPLASFVALDPDEVVHFICGHGNTVDPALRPYANFVNHENFAVAVARRRSIIFDGSAREPLNICGRVISRLRQAGYRVVFLVVLSSYPVARRRALAREQQTGRATADGFTRFVYSSLQKALPVYLRGCGPPVNAADGALLFTNEVDGARPKLEHVLVGRSDPAAVDAAIARGAELLALPS